MGGGGWGVWGFGFCVRGLGFRVGKTSFLGSCKRVLLGGSLIYSMRVRQGLRAKGLRLLTFLLEFLGSGPYLVLQGVLFGFWASGLRKEGIGSRSFDTSLGIPLSYRSRTCGIMQRIHPSTLGLSG